MFRRICILLLLAVSLAAGSPLSSPFDIYLLADRFDSTLQANIDTFHIPGTAAAIVQGDQVVYSETFGVTSTLHPANVTHSTLFRLASLSKGFSAVLTGKLVREGLLSWDESITEILPDSINPPDQDEAPITIRNILSQTSGYPAYTGTELLEQNLSYAGLLGYLQTVPRIDPPGRQFNYQNVVFNLISDIISIKSGLDFDACCWDKLFYPLHMYDACVGMEAFVNSHDRALPHIKVDSLWRATEVKPTYYHVPAAAGINASLNDMQSWLGAMLGHDPRVVSPNILAAIMTPYIETDKSSRYFGAWEHLGQTWYGMGWRIFDYRDLTLVYHGGYVEGFRAEIVLVPELDLGLVVMMNAATPFADNCVPMFLELMYRDHPEPENSNSQ